MTQLILTIILVYFFGGMIGYGVHWLIHQPWIGHLYEVHKSHHQKEYPLNNFLSETYRSSGKNNTTPYFTAVVALILLPFFLVMWKLDVPNWIMIVVLIESIVIGLINDWVHDSIHIKGHFLEKFKFFKRLRLAHRIHHANTSYNYGIFSFEWDFIMRSWKRPNINRD